MCTSINFTKTHHYFGRTLDLEYHYHEEVVITPRRFPLAFRHMPAMPTHYAMIGMATVVAHTPLYYEAVNEHGVCMAGLNFPANAHYFLPQEGLDNVTPFEFIPWILGQCRDMREVRALLSRINLIDEPFSPELPLSPLHWMISVKDESIVVESMKDGLHIHENPVQVMTNNPPFPMHLWNLVRFKALSPVQPDNTLAPSVPLDAYANGLGAVGLPGDWSSDARFVRAVYTLHHADCADTEEACVSQFFDMLGSVSIPGGCALVHGKAELTVYTSCCNADTGMYYYVTRENRAITAVNLHSANLDDSALVRYPLETTPRIRYL